MTHAFQAFLIHAHTHADTLIYTHTIFVYTVAASAQKGATIISVAMDLLYVPNPFFPFFVVFRECIKFIARSNKLIPLLASTMCAPLPPAHFV